MKLREVSIYLLIFMVIGFFSYFNTFETVEYFFQDKFLQNSGEIDTRIVIVGIDDDSLEKLGQWPWPRSYHATVIDKLSKGGASVIGLDIILSENARNPEEDNQLEKAMDKAQNVILSLYGGFAKKTIAGEMKALKILEPIEKLKKSAELGHINTFPDTDGIVRKAVAYYDFKGDHIKSFSWKIYEKFAKEMGIAEELDMELDAWNRFNISFSGEPGDFEHLSYYQVLNGEIPQEYFSDKIVLIGPYAAGIEDYYFTPLDYTSPMYGIELHANILQNFLHNDFRKNASIFVNLAIIFTIGLSTIIVFKKFKPFKALLIILGLMISYMYAVGYIYKMGYILAVFYPMLFAFIMYFLMLAYRYIEEMLERKRITNVFGRYVAPQVVNEILSLGENGLKLGGARKEITVLFVDIRGFTPLSEKAEPEEIVAILNEYLNLCAKSIFYNEGTLDKFIGDATMAIFNAPLNVENHALKAAQAAWAMKEGSKQLEEKLYQKFGRIVRFGIGINTGYAVVGNIGAETRMDYTAIGDTVNTAARLESNAKPGQILISQATYDLIKDKVKVTSLGDISVKGKTQGIAVYQLEGLKVE